MLKVTKICHTCDLCKKEASVGAIFYGDSHIFNTEDFLGHGESLNFRGARGTTLCLACLKKFISRWEVIHQEDCFLQSRDVDLLPY